MSEGPQLFMSFVFPTMKILDDGVWKSAVRQINLDQFVQLIGLTCWIVLGLWTLSHVASAALVEPERADVDADSIQIQKPNLAAIASLFEAVQLTSLETAVPLSSPLGGGPIQLIGELEAAKHPTQENAEADATISRLTVLNAHFNTVDDDEVTGNQVTGNELEAALVLLAVEAAIAPTPEISEEVGAIAQAADLLLEPESSADPVVNEPAATLTEFEAPIAAYRPLLQFQAASIFQDDELSGRLRTSALYALSDQVMLGATIDLVGGNAFVDSADEGLSLNELYVSAAPFRELPNLRFVGGLIDLTSYLDRNSFAKDVVTHFFNPVFQTNPALSAAGISSRPGLLVNWSVSDQLELKAVTFSSSRELAELALDGFAAEAGFRTGNLILRGTFSTARDAGDETGFEEIFQIQRESDRFGLLDDDRETALGLNAEYFIDSINLGLFGRYGWYENEAVDRSGNTFSVGANALDVFLDGDRLGLGYGQQLSNRDLRDEPPDVWEVFYDAPVYSQSSQVRVGVSLQSREAFSNTSLGVRVRADW